MVVEASLEFRLKNDLMSEKYKKTCKYLSYVENLLILVLAVIGCVSTSAFALLVEIPDSCRSYIEINVFAITTGIKKYKSMIKKKNKKHDKIVLLRKDKLNTIKVLISTSLIDPCISHLVITFHVESSSRLHRFWTANPRGNYYIDSMWRCQRRFDFQNRLNIVSFRCRINVTALLPVSFLSFLNIFCSGNLF